MTILHRLFARILSHHGHHTRQQRERERMKATTDAMRRNMGMAPIEWRR